MTESVLVLVPAAVFVLLHPAVRDLCDRHAVRDRLNPAPHAAPRRRDDADPVEFLQSVARAVRAGATAAQAVISAPAPSVAAALSQEMLREGAPLLHALQSGGPEMHTVAACVHHGTISATAIDHAVTLRRQERALDDEIRVATALSRRSAAMLTGLPFLLLCTGAAVSSSVRSTLQSPAVLLTIAAGAALNRAGHHWMSRTRRSVHAAVDASAVPMRILAGMAAHLHAGGTVLSAFERLAAHDTACAQVSLLLARGVPLTDALGPLMPVAPSLARVIIAGATDGLPLAPAVDTIVQDILTERAALARERTAELPARSTAPLVLLVLPSFLLLAVAPTALAAFRGLSAPRL